MSIQELSKSLVADVKAILEGKKLDPVGKADADIDNDGDTCLLYTSPSPRD